MPVGNNRMTPRPFQDLKAEFKGYHIEIQLYPSGGMIEIIGCEECGTDDSFSYSASWKDGGGRTFDEAKEILKESIRRSLANVTTA